MDFSGYQAALYLRISREDESEGPSESISNQQSLLKDYVKRNHITVFDTYTDDGFSGTGFHRPGFQRMLLDIEAKKINLVITKDLSRLGRDYILTGHYMERYFPEHGVRYISLLDGIDTGIESSANDITPFRAIMNDMYAKDISKKIKSVKRDKQRKGLFIGGKAVFGYRKHPNEKNAIVIDEQAAPFVQKIFALALSGSSCREIAMQLNREHVPTPAVYANLPQGRAGPYAGQWSGERISELLQNETYIGSTVQGRMRKVSYKSKKCARQPKENWIVVENTHAPIVDRETFQAVGRLIASRRHTRSRSHDHLLKGLIFCRECGAPLSVLCRKNAAGAQVLYYICRTYRRAPKTGVCTSHCIGERQVREAVMAMIQELYAPYLCEAYLLPIAQQAAAEAARQTCPDRAAIERELTTLRRKLDQMYLDKLDGTLCAEDYRRISTPLKLRQAALSEQHRPALPTKEQAQQWVSAYLDQLPADRTLVTTLVERIELTESKNVQLWWRFTLEE